VTSEPVNGPTNRLEIYVTDDGGTTWTARSTPADSAIAANRNDESGVPFASSNSSNWVVFVGSALYTTTDAGHSWVRSIPEPKLAAGTVSSIFFSSPRDGMAMAEQPGCPAPPIIWSDSLCTPSLIVTSDGGHHWAPRTP
jgi:photosystem II stability/assembly factor-like uncharacterized protein